MAKNKKGEEIAEAQEMTLEEAKAFRASLVQPKPEHVSAADKREEFRKYWAREKASFGKDKDLEPIIWAHLKAIGMDHPSQFEQGLQHFGLKKVK